MAKLTYRDAGLDLELYEKSLAGMVPFLKRTHTPRVLDGFGGFAGLFSLDYNSRLFARNYRHPVLVACNDGVGTKLKIAGMMNKHDTVGIDLVAMCVNDIAVSGAEPLFFLDYFATGKLSMSKAQEVVKGIAEGCRQAGCALVIHHEVDIGAAMRIVSVHSGPIVARPAFQRRRHHRVGIDAGNHHGPARAPCAPGGGIGSHVLNRAVDGVEMHQ